VAKVQRSTIRDVAREAGVGTTTVSRIINGGKLVSPEVRLRVERVIRQLGYEPSQAARALAQERSRSIGLIVPRITDPFFANIASAAHNVCRRNGHILLISASLDLEQQALDELKVFEQKRVDGLIIAPPPCTTSRLADYCGQLSKRVVSIDLPIVGQGISSILTDNAKASAGATQHLIEHGKRRILFLGADSAIYTTRERLRGYREAISSAGLHEVVTLNVSSFESAQKAIIGCYSGPHSIDGLITSNSMVGIYAFQVLQKHKISVPSRIAFITWGDFLLADTLRPSVTAIAQPTSELGRIATELLFSQLKESKPRTQHMEIPSQIIFRGSCGCK
jgi:LacI family transcriptional regulator